MTRVFIVVLTVAALLAPSVFGSASAAKPLAKKSCCQRCVCCIEKSSNSSPAPLAPPTRSTTEQSFSLAPAVMMALLFEQAPMATTVPTFRAQRFAADAPIFLRHRAILI
jgi:hypothetical protein